MKPLEASNNLYHDLNSLNQLRMQSKTSQRETLRAAVKEFEAYFLNLMLKNMRQANKVFAEDNPLSSNDVEFYNEMHDQQLALELSRSSKFGIGDLLFRQLSQHLPKDGGEKETPTIKLAEKQPVNRSEQATFSSPYLISALKEQRNKAIDNNNKGLSPELNQTAISTKADLTEKSELAFNSKQDFIESIKPYAIEASKALGINPGVLIAQAALETGWGKFLPKDTKGNPSMNLFGIKADSRWDGNRVHTTTLEFIEGIPEKLTQAFRAYDSLKESFEDYVDFIQSNPRYQNALEKTESPKEYLDEIQNSGYATDPNYADKIHSIFMREQLFKITD